MADMDRTEQSGDGSEVRDADAIRAVLTSGMWDGAWAKRTILGLLDDLDATRKVLGFADGNCVANTDFALADLYAEDCQWAQDALSAAGCHPRGKIPALRRVFVPDEWNETGADGGLERDHAATMATLCPCGHPYSDHNKDRSGGGPPFCSYTLSRRCGCNGLGLDL